MREISFSANSLPKADFNATDYDELDLNLGVHQLSIGTHQLAFHALSSADGHTKPLAVEMLRLLALPPEATRPVKGKEEAHFIRLGIGRAVYAYRLAYGELPEKLETLVKSGLLSKRFLLNENEKPLIARRHHDSFVVESPYPPVPWTNSWQGLDARR